MNDSDESRELQGETEDSRVAHQEMDEFLDSHFGGANTGEIHLGEVVDERDDGFVINFQYKEDGFLPKVELSEGQRKNIPVVILPGRREDGLFRLSHKRAVRIQAWQEKADSLKEGSLVEGKISQKIKGGFLVLFDGVEGFLPFTECRDGERSPIPRVGDSYQFLLIEIKRKRQSCILSRKSLIKEEKVNFFKNLLEKMERKEPINGRIKSITKHGVFVDLGVLDGLIRHHDVSWDINARAENLLDEGKGIDVLILAVEPKEERIFLGLKQLGKSPYDELKDTGLPDHVVSGKVVGVTDVVTVYVAKYRVRVSIEKSEVIWGGTNGIHKLFRNGDTVNVIMSKLDSEKMEITGSIKRTKFSNIAQLKEKYKSGESWTGRFVERDPRGVRFVIDGDVVGFLPIAESGWIAAEREKFVKSRIDKKKLQVTGFEKNELRLSLKRLTPNPYYDFEKKFKPQSLVEGIVAYRGKEKVSIRLWKGLEGIIPGVEAEKSRRPFRSGQKIEVVIKKIIPEEEIIILSVRGLRDIKAKKEVEAYIDSGDQGPSFSLGDILKKNS